MNTLSVGSKQITMYSGNWLNVTFLILNILIVNCLYKLFIRWFMGINFKY